MFFNDKNKIKNKKINLVIQIVGLFFLCLFLIYILTFTFNFATSAGTVFGVTFSNKYAKELGLDWQKTYLAVLDDLNVSHLRLVAYWDDIEVKPGKYDFFDLDWQITQAEVRDRKIILSVGQRMPRWPECHRPNWVSSLNSEQSTKSLMNFLTATVNRYKSSGNIIAWQVENEPLLSIFGECPTPDINLLKKEVALVKDLDKSRPIIVTDSGELSTWQSAATVPDILGVTLYRIVWNKYTGFWDYFFVPPSFYRFKADITQVLHKNLKGVIVTEMQMEPWTLGKAMTEMTLKEQQRSFNLQRFKNNIYYAQKTGISQNYLWGVEYWYWLKESGQPQIWNQAKTLWLH